MYKAYITTLKNVRSHPNADRMLLADCFGNTVCVGLEAKENDVIIYFPVDGELSKEYAEINNLVRIKNEDGTYSGGYLDPKKRNIKAIKLRGEKSDGLVMPLESLSSFGDVSTLQIGDTIDVFNGHEICKKYIPKVKEKRSFSGGNKTRKRKIPIAPLFAEHADTEQLAYNLDAFKAGDEVEITLKMHGTSQRTGYLPVFKGYVGSPFFLFLYKHFDRFAGMAEKHLTPIYDWGYVSGTRRTVLNDFEGGFYGSDKFREPHAKSFEGKLWKGEEVFYEVVGFTDTGIPIMPTVSNKKTNDKEFIKQYGETTTFSYGCRPIGFDLNSSYFEGNIEEGIIKDCPQSDIYVYRMTMTNEDGEVVEYTPDFMRYRCEQMGVKTVPVLWKGIIPPDEWVEECYDCEGELGNWACHREGSAGEWIKNKAEQFYDGPDPIGKTHVREGVVCRILNRPKFTAYKHKNFSFKVIEGIAKNDAEAPDIEEAQEVSDEG